MIKFAVAGSLDYLDKIKFLTENGYVPDLIIGNEKIHLHKDSIKKNKIELLVCFAYSNILTIEEINLFKKGCINYHSGLPKYRGRHPLNWMIIDGIKKIPNAIHFMDEGIDTGDIIIKRDIIIEREDNYNTILEKQKLISQDMMLKAINLIERGKAIRTPQNVAKLGYKRKRTPEDSKIDWSQKSFEIHNFVSALVDPMPNAFSFLDGDRIEIKNSFIGSESGLVLGKLSNRRYIISSGDGVVLVDTNKTLNVGDKLI